MSLSSKPIPTDVHDWFVRLFNPTWTNNTPTITLIGGRVFCNLEWWNSLTDDQKIAIMKHEMDHLLNRGYL